MVILILKQLISKQMRWPSSLLVMLLLNGLFQLRSRLNWTEPNESVKFTVT